MEIELINVSADYQIGPIRSPLVLNAVNLQIEQGTFNAVVGHTGAGKSSLLRLLNGLLLPVKGTVKIQDLVINEQNNKRVIKAVRKKVGMVFQFPESQLFAETVEKDICFGPLNFGVPEEKAKAIAKQVIQQVGLDPAILTKSPFSLSGGQKRRVAIAGILAMEPDILILDEPGAGLDPNGKKEIMSLIELWNRKKGLTTLVVTHDMNDVAHYAENVIVMEKGTIVTQLTPRALFTDIFQIEKWQLSVPDARRLQLKIEEKTGVQLPTICLTAEELANALIEVGLV